MSDIPEVYVVKNDGPTKLALMKLLTTAGLRSRTFDTGRAFLEACGRLPPGCVITSFQTRGMDAFEFLRRLSAEPASFPAIVMGSEGDVPQAVDAMKAGAATVLEQPYGDQVLLGAVRSALAAEARTAGETIQRLAFATLTPREEEVLSGLLGGKTNKTIARDLGISPRTVEIYRASVMKKAGVGSIPELVRLAVGAKRLH